MSILLDNVYELLQSGDISSEQALYMIFLDNDSPYAIEPEEIMELIEDGHIKNNRITKKLYTEISTIGDDKVRKGTIKANYMNDVSKEVVKKLARLLCLRNPETGLIRLPGDEDAKDPVITNAQKYLQNEQLVSIHFIIFLYLFPVKGSFNRKWEKHFTGAEYTGAKLRTRSKAVGSAFLKSVKKRDMGAFLYGTYLYITSSVQGTKTFIKTMPGYLKEHDEWYYMAEEAIKKAKTVDELFKRPEMNKEGRITIAL